MMMMMMMMMMVMNKAAALETRASPLCYLHVVQGGGAISDKAHDATAFGCFRLLSAGTLPVS
jgi:hypothetical protein